MTWKSSSAILIAVAGALALGQTAGKLGGQETAAALSIDATILPAAVRALPFPIGGRSPDGREITANSRYLLLGGKPWFPVMGEFHYTRYPEQDWEREILKMKAGGVRIVSTYVFWIHHEEIEGEFDWSGRRDLRRFVSAAAKHGMMVWVRLGPWAHGECRNGGLPDWVLAKTKVRQNDPEYLRYVARFYGQIGAQLKSLFWKDGGPVIGIQIENEYSARGAGQGEEHILELRRLARQAGMDAPFYTVTGWDNAAVPERDVLPVFGGYADGFWYRPLTELPPSPHYFFTPIRCEENVDLGLRSKRPDLDERYAGLPFLTAEMGGGMTFAYHRRPLMTADDIAAMQLVKLGAGVTLYGYYMYHGGTNPDGKRTTLQESQATDYPQDLPVKTYDFQAPLGEFGQMHPSFRDLKTVHSFLADFGEMLAPMTAVFPAQRPRDRRDCDTPRVSLRAEGSRGFLFVNNYQRVYPLPARKNLQVHLKLPGVALDLPRRPVDIPAGAYTFWPVNLPVPGATIEYATAQLVTRLDDPKTYVFFAWPGIAGEFAFRLDPGASLEAPGARIVRQGERTYVERLTPGPEIAMRIQTAGGQTVNILVLSREQARNIWKATLGGRERLLLSPADLFVESNRVHLGATDPSQLRLAVFPALGNGIPGFRASGPEGIFESYAAQVAPVTLPVKVRQLATGRAAPVRMGKEVAMAPLDTDFQTAARWSIGLSNPVSPSVDEVLLRVAYEGDVARAYAGTRFLTDDFYHGGVWEIGLRHVTPAELEHGLTLEVLPLRKGAPIYLPPQALPVFPPSGEIARLLEVRAIAAYQAVAEIAPQLPVQASSKRTNAR